MTEEIDNRPYRLVNVGIGDYDPSQESSTPAYSNVVGIGENPWPLFTKGQMEAFQELTTSKHFQLFWIEDLDTYAVVVGYDNSLQEEFPIGDNMESVMEGEEVDVYDDGKGFRIDYAKKHVIEVDGEQIEAFNFDCIGYDFWMADEPVAKADFK